MKYIFFALNVSVDLIAHVMMFFLWRDFLGFNNIYLQIAIGAILLMFLALTVIAPLCIHWRDNIWSRSLYVVVGLWLGFMLNSVLLAAIFYLAYIIFPGLEITLALKSLYIILLPLLFLLPEAWAAQSWRIKRVSVAIKNLPDFWEGKEILHVSDVHLGPIWRQSFFDRLVSKINSIKAEAIFITGDLFDGMEADFSWFHKRRIIASSGVYYAFGNHDIILGKDRVKALLKDSGIMVLDDVLHEEKGLQILGLSCYYEGHLDVSKKILEEMKCCFDKPSILLYHEPKDIKAIRNAKVDLQLSGHTHGGQLWPFNFIAKILYRGFVYGVYKLKDYTLSVTAGAGTWGPPLRLGSRSELVLLKLVKRT